MQNISCQEGHQASIGGGEGDQAREQVSFGRTGLSGKKSSTVTKIILKDAAKPHHNLSERVAQVSVCKGMQDADRMGEKGDTMIRMSLCE